MVLSLTRTWTSRAWKNVTFFSLGKILWVPYLDVCGHEKVMFCQLRMSDLEEKTSWPKRKYSSSKGDINANLVVAVHGKLNSIVTFEHWFSVFIVSLIQRKVLTFRWNADGPWPCNRSVSRRVGVIWSCFGELMSRRKQKHIKILHCLHIRLKKLICGFNDECFYARVAQGRGVGLTNSNPCGWGAGGGGEVGIFQNPTFQNQVGGGGGGGGEAFP